MKILLVIDGMHPRHGGPPAVVAGSARALVARGHDVTVLSTLSEPDRAEVLQAWQPMVEDGVQFEFCQPVGLRDLLTGARERRRFDAFVDWADVIHLHGVWNPVMLSVARSARIRSTPYVVSIHGVFDHRAMYRLKGKWIKKRIAIELFDIRGFLRDAHALIFGGQAEVEQSWMPTKDVRIELIPNGAAKNLGQSTPDEAMVARLNEVAPAYDDWAPKMLCRSRIHQEKGLDLLFEAFESVAGTFPEAGILVAGLEQDDRFQAKLERHIASSQCSDRLVLTTELTGPRSQFLYGTCDVFLLPSLAEGFSMSLIEALANGCPVLITKYCHFPEVETSGAGFVVDPTVAGLRGGLAKMLSLSDEERREMGRAARQMFLDNYSWERVSEKLEATYFAATSARSENSDVAG